MKPTNCDACERMALCHDGLCVECAEDESNWSEEQRDWSRTTGRSYAQDAADALVTRALRQARVIAGLRALGTAVAA
jgi:hypothetical protein